MLLFGFLTLFVSMLNSVQATLHEPDKTIYVLTESISPFLCLEVLIFLIVYELLTICFYHKDSLLVIIMNKLIRIFACIALISMAISTNPMKMNTENALGTKSILSIKDTDVLFDKKTLIETLKVADKKAEPNTHQANK